MLSRVLSKVDHVCHWAVSGCRPACCAGVAPFRVLRIMFAIGRCQGAVQRALQGAVQGAPDHVCHWAVSGGSCLPGRCPAVLSRVLRITFAIGRCQGAVNSTF